jgi:hypothetical protein
MVPDVWCMGFVACHSSPAHHEHLQCAWALAFSSPASFLGFGFVFGGFAIAVD